MELILRESRIFCQNLGFSSTFLEDFRGYLLKFCRSLYGWKLLMINDWISPCNILVMLLNEWIDVQEKIGVTELDNCYKYTSC